MAWHTWCAHLMIQPASAPADGHQGIGSYALPHMHFYSMLAVDHVRNEEVNLMWQVQHAATSERRLETPQWLAASSNQEISGFPNILFGWIWWPESWPQYTGKEIGLTWSLTQKISFVSKWHNWLSCPTPVLFCKQPKKSYNSHSVGITFIQWTLKPQRHTRLFLTHVIFVSDMCINLYNI